MSVTPINTRDLRLQATSPRILRVGSNYINLSASTTQFKYGTDNVAQPAQSVITATLVNALSGQVVTFSYSGLNAAPTVYANNTVTIDPANITDDLATITASLTFQGNTYSNSITISKIYNQLVSRIKRPTDLMSSANDGTGYALPDTANYVEIYNGVVKVTGGITYGPATTTKNGLTVNVNTSTGEITVSGTNWTTDSESFVLTATKSSIAYDSTYTITKAKAGQSAITGVLSNEAAVLPASNDGTISALNYAAGSTTMYVYNGSRDDSANWTYLSTYTNCTSSTAATNRTQTVNNLTADVGFITITASRSGYSNIIQTFTITKAKAGTSGTAGTSGADATAYWLVTSSSVLGRNSIGTLNPTTLTVYGYSATGVSAPAIYSGRFKIYENGSSTASYTSTANETNYYIYTPTANATSIKVELYASDGFTVKLDEETIPVVKDGVDSITAVLSNETATVAADNAGTVTSLVSGTTTMTVYNGSTDVSSSYTFAATLSGCTATGSNSNRTWTVDTINAIADTATITITATRTGYPTLTRIFDISKAKGGASATVYWLTTSSDVLGKSAAGVLNPTTLTVTGYTAVGNGTPTTYAGRFKVYENGSSTASYSTLVNAISYTYTPTATATSIKVEFYLASATAFTTKVDEQIVPVVKDAVNNIIATLSNETATVPKDTAGTVILTGATTTMTVYDGATDVSSSYTFSATLSGCTATASNSNRTYDVATVTSDAATITIKASRTGYPTLTRIFTITTVTDGFDGTAYWLTLGTDVLQKSSAGVLSPSVLNVYAYSSQGALGPAAYAGYFKIYEDGSATARYTSATGQTTTGYSPSGSSITSIKVELWTVGTTALPTSKKVDEQTIYIVKDGAPGVDAITALLSNDAHVVPADNSGGVSTSGFAGATTTMYIYKGTVDDSAGWTYTPTYNNCTATASNSNRTYAVTALSADVGTITITATRTGYATIVQVFSISKAKAGDNATSYWVATNAEVFVRSSAGALNPATFTAYAYSSTGKSAPAAYSGRFRIYENNSTSTTSTSTLDEISRTYTPSAGVTSIKVELYTSGPTFLTKLDEQIIVVVSDGTNGTSSITGVLSNEAATLPANAAGIVSSYTGAVTTMTVYNGATDDSANWTFAATVSGCTATASNSNRTQTLTAMSTSGDAASVTITASRTGYTSVVKVFNITKVRAGVAGTDATAYWLVASAAAIQKNLSGTYNPSTLIVNSYSSTATTGPKLTVGAFKIFENGSATASYTSGANQNTYTYTPSSTANRIKVELYQDVTFATKLDEQTIPIVSDGASGSDGTAGSSFARIEIYQNSLTLPTVPANGATNYVINTNILAGTPGSWSLTKPAASTTPTYMSTTNIITSTPGIAAVANNWTTPVIIGQSGSNGTAGAPGATIATLELFSNTTNTVPNNNAVTYIISTNTLGPTTTAYAGWSLTMPTTTTAPTYMTTATISTSTPGTAFTIPTWTAPVIAAQNGSNGSNGSNGVNGSNGTAGFSIARVELYQAGSSPPTKPAVNAATYIISTNTMGGSYGSWSLSMPTSTTTPTYMTTATVSTNTPATAFTIPSWTDPVIVAQNGVNGTSGSSGTNGANGNQAVTIYMYAWGNTQPAIPSTSVTYTWATAAVSAYAAGWSASPAAGALGSTLYEARLVFSASALDASTTKNWVNATVMAVGANGINGNSITGATGAQTHRIYIAGTTTAPNGGNAPGNTTVGTVPTGWSASPVTLNSTNNTQWQSDGVTAAGASTTAWSAPYLSYFKVANLSAIAADIGTITAGSISSVTLTVGSAPAIDGTSMSGSGAKINSDGSFALGNNTTNIIGNASGSIYLNGSIIATGNILNNAVSQQGGSSANNEVYVENQDWTTILQGSYVTPGIGGSVSVITNVRVTLGSLYSPWLVYGQTAPSYFRIYRCVNSNGFIYEYLLSEFFVGLFANTNCWAVFDTPATTDQVFYRVKALDYSDFTGRTVYTQRSLIVLSLKK